MRYNSRQGVAKHVSYNELSVEKGVEVNKKDTDTTERVLQI